jgi:hypothetical protein
MGGYAELLGGAFRIRGWIEGRLGRGIGDESAPLDLHFVPSAAK